MKKYLKDGREVIVENETIDGRFIVRTIMNVTDDYGDCFEHESGNVILVSKDELCNLSPTEKYEKTVSNLRDEISKHKETIKSIKDETIESEKKLTKIKRELTDSDMKTAHTINRLGRFVDDPTMIIDYFLGGFTHIVIEDRWWPSLETFDEVYRKKIDLSMQSEGKRRVRLAVKVRDYWRTGTPCKSKEEALALLKIKIEYAHIDKPGVMIKEADKYGIVVDQKYIDRYGELQKKDKEKKRRELEKKIKAL